eukprot:2452060-Amphidinium_carterae.1
METVRPPSSGDAALTNTPELPRSSRLDARGFSQDPWSVACATPPRTAKWATCWAFLTHLRMHIRSQRC